MQGRIDIGSLWRLTRGFSAYALLPLVGLITAPILARILGPTGRGQLAAVLQPLTVMDAVLLAGVPTAVTFFMGRGHAFKAIAKKVLIVSGSAAAFTIVIIYFYSHEISSVTAIDRHFIIAVWLSSVIGLLIALRRAVLQGYGALGRLDLERSLFAVFRLALIAFLAYWGINQVKPYILAYIIPGIIAAIVLIPSGNGNLVRSYPEHSVREPAKRENFYKFTFLAGSGSVAQAFNNRADQAILPLFLTATELGIYSVAITFAEVPLILSLVIARNLLSEASKRLPVHSLIRTAILGNAVVFLVALVLWTLAPMAIEMLFGVSFDASTGVARLALVGTVLASVAASSNAILAGSGYAGNAFIPPLLGIITLATGLFILSNEMNLFVAAALLVASRLISASSSVLLLYLKWKSGKEYAE